MPPYDSAVASFKDTLAAIREFAIICVVLTVLFWPEVLVRWAKAFNDEARKAGAKSSEFVLGPEKLAFDNSAAQLSELSDATKTNEDVKKLAQELTSKTSSPQNVERAKQIEQAADTLGSRLKASISATKTTLLAQDQAIQKASGLTSGEGTYGIVVSADKQEDLAAYEVAQLEKRNVTDIRIYDREGFLRTVAAYADNQSAEAEIPMIQRYRKSAYIINLSKWCPYPDDSGKKIGGAAVLTCG